MFIQELDDVPDNLGEKQISMNPKETLENQSEGGYLEMFENELDDVPNNRVEKQVT